MKKHLKEKILAGICTLIYVLGFEPLTGQPDKDSFFIEPIAPGRACVWSPSQDVYPVHNDTSRGKHHDTLFISTGEWRPWTGKNLKNYGVICHVVEEVFDRAGYPVRFEFYPWQRTWDKVKTGKVHASAYWYQSEYRRKYCYYSNPITRESIVFFYRKSEPMKAWQDLNDLDSYRIGISRGNTYTDEFRQMGKKGVLTFDKANNDLSNFRKLVAGRIDIFPCAKIRGYQLMQESFPDSVAASLMHHPKALTHTNGFLVFPKNRPGAARLLKIFNKHLSELKQEGVYRKYMQKIKPKLLDNEN